MAQTFPDSVMLVELRWLCGDHNPHLIPRKDLTAAIRSVAYVGKRAGVVMSRFYVRYAYLGLLLLTAWPLHAVGCVDSPENPTVILGLIGLAGACYGPVKSKLASIKRKN